MNKRKGVSIVELIFSLLNFEYLCVFICTLWNKSLYMIKISLDVLNDLINDVHLSMKVCCYRSKKSTFLSILSVRVIIWWQSIQVNKKWHNYILKLTLAHLYWKNKLLTTESDWWHGMMNLSTWNNSGKCFRWKVIDVLQNFPFFFATCHNLTPWYILSALAQ